MTKVVTIHFPKQNKDYNIASRFIRMGVFGEFVTNKSKDRRTITLSFPDESKFNILYPMLTEILIENGYEYKEL